MVPESAARPSSSCGLEPMTERRPGRGGPRGGGHVGGEGGADFDGDGAAEGAAEGPAEDADEGAADGGPELPMTRRARAARPAACANGSARAA